MTEKKDKKCDQSLVEHAIMELISEKDFDGYLATHFDIRVVDSLPSEVQTAALIYINGRFFIRVCQEWFAKKTNEERVAVIKHEIAHFVNKHFSRRNGRDSMIFNIANDCAINQGIGNLPDDCIKLPSGWPPNDSSELYYDKYVENLQKSPKSASGQDKGGQGKPQQGQGKPQQGQSQDGTGGNLPDLFDEEMDAPMNAGAEAESMADEICRETIKDRLNAGVSPEKLRGLHAGALEGYIDDLTAPPMIDWKHALTRFAASLADVQNRMTLKRPDRRQLSPFGRRKEYLPSLVVCVDTSGSVSDEMLGKFFSQIALLGRQLSEVEVVIADADVHESFTFKQGMESKLAHSAFGRGGTDFDPAVQYINKNLSHCDGAVYLTDGYCPVPQTKCRIPMIWIVDGSKDFEGRPKITVENDAAERSRGW